MSVEQLIEDGKEQHNICEVNSSRAFEAGVRHALASLFPVVKVEDLEEGVLYLYCLAGHDHWEGLCEGELLQGLEYNHQFPSRYKDIRRCPTPGDLGTGGEG